MREVNVDELLPGDLILGRTFGGTFVSRFLFQEESQLIHAPYVVLQIKKTNIRYSNTFTQDIRVLCCDGIVRTKVFFDRELKVTIESFSVD
jgi:hypothetical protein